MSKQPVMGVVSFINHDKDYATIEYSLNGKKKTINGDISLRSQEKLKAEKIIKKVHRFHVGDEVSFVIAPSARGDKMIADCIEFKFNNALDSLLNKSAIENRFVGYLKKVGDDYFVKETGSYIFFPLKLSPWEKPPQEHSLNEPFFFRIENAEKGDKATAASYKPVYIPEYLAATKHFKNKTPLDGTVSRITQHAIFIDLFQGKLQARVPITPETALQQTGLKPGDQMRVLINYLGTNRIVVEKA